MTVTHLANVLAFEGVLENGGTHAFEITLDEMPELQGMAGIDKGAEMVCKPTDRHGVWAGILNRLAARRGTCLYRRTPQGTYEVRCTVPIWIDEADALIAIDHVSASTQYRTILREGGTHTFEIDAEDIDYRGLFERLQVITDPSQPFMLPPFDVGDPKVLEHPWRPSHAWEIVVEQVYSRKGHIVYYRTKDGRYRAVCSVPISSASGE